MNNLKSQDTVDGDSSGAKSFCLGYRLLKQRLQESFLISHVVLMVVLGIGVVNAVLGRKAVAFVQLSQVHRSARLLSIKKLVEPWIINNLTIHSASRITNVTLSVFKQNIGKRIIVLKRKVSDDEPGVILVKYSETLPLLPQFFDMQALLKDYQLVFEPSWSGYCTADILHYTSYSEDIFFLAKQQDDFRFLEVLDTNLYPVDLGPCDWVDPSIAQSHLSQRKIYDVVMNSNWGTAKRHHVLFSAIREIKQQLSIALIGFDWDGRTQQDIADIADYYGVLDQITFFQKITFDEVMKINCQSKMAILLSLKEGSNRSIAEALFCDIPVIVLNNHIGGIVGNVVPDTGELVREADLAGAIEKMLDDTAKYHPRQWAVDNISCLRSTEVLNEHIKRSVLRRGGQWTEDIVVRSNSPDLRYYHQSDILKFAEYNDMLRKFLK